MAFDDNMLMLMRENNELLKALIKEIRNMSLLFEKYDAEYQVEIENQGAIPEGWQKTVKRIV